MRTAADHYTMAGETEWTDMDAEIVWSGVEAEQGTEVEADAGITVIMPPHHMMGRGVMIVAMVSNMMMSVMGRCRRRSRD